MEQVFVVTFWGTEAEASRLAAQLNDDGQVKDPAAFGGLLGSIGDGCLAVMTGDEFCHRSAPKQYKPLGYQPQDAGLARRVDF